MLEEPSIVENDEHGNGSTSNLKPRQEASCDANDFPEDQELPKKHLHEEEAPTMNLCHIFDEPVESDGMQPSKRLNANEAQAVSTEPSPTGRLAKRKFSGEETASDSPSSKQSSSKKLEVEDTCRSAKVQEVSDSATSLKKCKDLQTNSPEMHHATIPIPPLARVASNLVALKSLQGAGSIKKTTVSPSLQSSRLLLGSLEYKSSQQRQSSLVSGKTSTTHLQSMRAPQKKPIMLERLQRPSLPLVSQPNRSLGQLAPVMDISSRSLQERRGYVKLKQLDGVPLQKTSGLAILSKSKAMGSLRQSCERTFKFDVGTGKGTNALAFAQSRRGVASLKTLGGRDEKHALENPDTEMADTQSVESTRKSSSDKEIVPTNAAESIVANTQDPQTLKEETVQMKGGGSHLAIPAEHDTVINEKAEYYAERLDQLLNDVKNQYEEAMDLRVRAMVVNNSFMMLNDPVADEKIRKITNYLREKLCLDVQVPPLMQPG